jgi:hypothetical protein
MGYHYRARYEFILFFEKGKRRLNDLGISDVLSVPRVHGGYPAEKPVGVSEILIGQSSQPGDTVADPFMGSGSVGVAALKAGRRFLGNDLNPEAVRLAATRLRELGEGTQPADTREDTPSDLIELMRPQPSQTSQPSNHDRRRIRQPDRRVRGPPVRRPRRQGLSRDQGRQVDHRQEPVHRRLLRLRGDQQGLRDRMQVPG